MRSLERDRKGTLYSLSLSHPRSYHHHNAYLNTSPTHTNQQSLNKEAITRALDACLCTEEEVAAARAGKLDDPLFGDDDEEESA